MKRDAIIVERRKPGLTARIREFYENNPDEELTFKAVQEKFGCTRFMACKIVYQLVGLGLLESVHVIRLRTKGMATKEDTQ